MALFGYSRDFGSTLFIEGIKSSSFNGTYVQFTDCDGARISISGDVFAHLLGVVAMELSTSNVNDLLYRLCTCNKGEVTT